MTELTVKIDARPSEAMQALVDAGFTVHQARAHGVVVPVPVASPKPAPNATAKPRKRKLSKATAKK